MEERVAEGFGAAAERTRDNSTAPPIDLADIEKLTMINTSIYGRKSLECL